jgi:hypothetical protein
MRHNLPTNHAIQSTNPSIFHRVIKIHFAQVRVISFEEV